MGLEIVATHGFDTCWPSPDVKAVCQAFAPSLLGSKFPLQIESCTDLWAGVGARRGPAEDGVYRLSRAAMSTGGEVSPERNFMSARPPAGT